MLQGDHFGDSVIGLEAATAPIGAPWALMATTPAADVLRVPSMEVMNIDLTLFPSKVAPNPFPVMESTGVTVPDAPRTVNIRCVWSLHQTPTESVRVAAAIARTSNLSPA